MRVKFTKDLYFVFGFPRPIDALPVTIQMDPLAVRNRRLARQRPSRLMSVAIDCQFASARRGDAAARTPERQHPRGRPLVRRMPCGARGTRVAFSGMRLNFPSLDLIYLDVSLSTPYSAQMASPINGGP